MHFGAKYETKYDSTPGVGHYDRTKSEKYFYANVPVRKLIKDSYVKPPVKVLKKRISTRPEPNDSGNKPFG